MSVRVECEVHSEIFDAFHISGHRQCFWFGERTWTSVNVRARVGRCANSPPMNIEIMIRIGSNALGSMRLTSLAPHSELEIASYTYFLVSVWPMFLKSTPLTFVCVQEYPSTLNTGTIIQSVFRAKSTIAGFRDVSSSFKKYVEVAGAIHSRAWIAASTRTTGLPCLIYRFYMNLDIRIIFIFQNLTLLCDNLTPRIVRFSNDRPTTTFVSIWGNSLSSRLTIYG